MDLALAPAQDYAPVSRGNAMSEEEATSGSLALANIMDKDVDVAALVARPRVEDDFVLEFAIQPHVNTVFDEANFKSLLALSPSLTAGEKRRILEGVPFFSQYQIDELIRIFMEERDKFLGLEIERANREDHRGKLQELRDKYEHAGFLAAGPEEPVRGS